MSDDYLWDKSGKDEQVESLERSLGGLKYDRDAPPLEKAARTRSRLSEIALSPMPTR